MASVLAVSNSLLTRETFLLDLNYSQFNIKMKTKLKSYQFDFF